MGSENSDVLAVSEVAVISAVLAISEDLVVSEVSSTSFVLDVSEELDASSTWLVLDVSEGLHTPDKDWRRKKAATTLAGWEEKYVQASRRTAFTHIQME